MVKFEKIRTGLRWPVGTNGCPQGPHWPPSEPLGLAMPAARGQPVRSRAPGNQGNRAPDRPAPVTAHPDMRRCLTGPSPDGPSPHDRGRSRGRSRAARRCRGDSPTWPGGESAGDGHPYHAHVRVARARGAGRPGSRPSARRRPGRHRGRHRAIVRCRARDRIPPGPGPRASAGTRCARQRRTRATPGPGSEGIWPASPAAADARRSRPSSRARRQATAASMRRRAPGPGRRQAVQAARRATASVMAVGVNPNWPHCSPTVGPLQSATAKREAPWPPHTGRPRRAPVQ